MVEAFSVGDAMKEVTKGVVGAADGGGQGNRSEILKLARLIRVSSTDEAVRWVVINWGLHKLTGDVPRMFDGGIRAAPSRR
jgi:hypothetical protein